MEELASRSDCANGTNGLCREAQRLADVDDGRLWAWESPYALHLQHISLPGRESVEAWEDFNVLWRKKLRASRQPRVDTYPHILRPTTPIIDFRWLAGELAGWLAGGIAEQFDSLARITGLGGQGAQSSQAKLIPESQGQARLAIPTGFGFIVEPI